MMQKDLPFICRRVRELREAAGLTQMQLAMAAGVSLSMVTQIEQGRQADLKVSTAAALAEALGVPVCDLVDDPGKKPRKKK